MMKLMKRETLLTSPSQKTWKKLQLTHTKKTNRASASPASCSATSAAASTRAPRSPSARPTSATAPFSRTAAPASSRSGTRRARSATPPWRHYTTAGPRRRRSCSTSGTGRASRRRGTGSGSCRGTPGPGSVRVFFFSLLSFSSLPREIFFADFLSLPFSLSISLSPLSKSPDSQSSSWWGTRSTSPRSPESSRRQRQRSLRSGEGVFFFSLLERERDLVFLFSFLLIIFGGKNEEKNSKQERHALRRGLGQSGPKRQGGV